MGLFLALSGFGWAILGVYNIINQLNSPDATVLNVVINLFIYVIACVIPGLLVAGIGQNMRYKTVTPETDGTTKKCPFCAEDIKQAAIICKHCNRDIASISNINQNLAKTV